MRRARAWVRRETVLLAVAIAVLVAVGVIANRVNEKPSSFDSFSTYDASPGGYRALYALLGRENLRVERFEQRPAFLDAGIATLVYVEPSAGDPRAVTPTDADKAALETWVRGGGSLLYVGYDDAAARAGVLQLPRREYSLVPAPPFVALELRARGVTHISAARETLRFVVRRVARRARAQLLVGDGRGALVVAYPYGRGRIVAVCDRWLFTNGGTARGDGIARGERARLAVALAQPRARRGIVAFDETPHGYATPERWWSIVPRPFAFALAVALVALLIAIAGAALRLGPPLLPVPRDGRSSADFLDAVASLFERNGEVRGTLELAAAATSRTIARTHGLEGVASNEAIAACIEREDLRASFLTMQRLATSGGADTATLVRGVALAQQLRKEYSAHGRSCN